MRITWCNTGVREGNISRWPCVFCLPPLPKAPSLAVGMVLISNRMCSFRHLFLVTMSNMWPRPNQVWTQSGVCQGHQLSVSSEQTHPEIGLWDQMHPWAEFSASQVRVWWGHKAVIPWEFCLKSLLLGLKPIANEQYPSVKDEAKKQPLSYFLSAWEKWWKKAGETASLWISKHILNRRM